MARPAATPEERQAFVEKVTPYAAQVAADTGLDPKFVIAHSALETDWGRSAPGNNYFGIKGPGQTQATTEYYNGKKTAEKASFRAYSSPAESFQDYARLMNKPMYASVRQAQGLPAQAAAMQA